MIKTTITAKTLLFDGPVKPLRASKLLEGVKISPSVVYREVFDVDSSGFSEVLQKKSGATVKRQYSVDDSFQNPVLRKKIVIPANTKRISTNTFELEFETVYSKAGEFLATLRSDLKNNIFKSFFKNPETGKMNSADGIGAFNRAVQDKE